jgi:hypothetical protein
MMMMMMMMIMIIIIIIIVVVVVIIIIIIIHSVAVGVVTGLLAIQFEVCSPEVSRAFSFVQEFQTGSGTHRAPYSIGNGNLLVAIRRPLHVANRLPSFAARVRVSRATR